MASIQWSSFICDREGRVDQKLVRSQVSVILAIGGGVALILAMLGISIGACDRTHMVLGAVALIAPLTGGRVTEWLSSRRGPTFVPPEEES